PGRAGAAPGDSGPEARRGGSGEGLRTRGSPAGGWVLLEGPGVVPGVGDEPWDPMDLAPTLLNLRGFPRDRGMPGLARTGFLRPEWRARLTPRVIDTFGQNLPSEF